MSGAEERPGAAFANPNARPNHQPSGERVVAGRKKARFGAELLPVGPDAELIATCAQHCLNLKAVNARRPKRPEAENWAAYDVTRDAISAANPETTEGMVAKARAALAEACGVEPTFHGFDGQWAYDLMQDMLRLHAAPPATQQDYAVITFPAWLEGAAALGDCRDWMQRSSDVWPTLAMATSVLKFDDVTLTANFRADRSAREDQHDDDTLALVDEIQKQKTVYEGLVGLLRSAEIRLLVVMSRLAAEPDPPSQLTVGVQS